jgi:glycosyltransferase involved in cell wall biosynthesis
MKILYDHQAFSFQEYGGISKYFVELMKKYGDSEESYELSTCFSNNINLREVAIRPNFFPNFSFKGKNRLMTEINKANSLLNLNEHKYDIFHPTYYDTYFLNRKKKNPFVITCHDLIHEKFSKLYPEFNLKSKLVEQKIKLLKTADKIISVSESTKKDLIDIYNIPEEKIKVIYLACSFPENNINECDISKDKYILYVGSRRIYKNFHFMLESISNILIKENIILLCAGSNPFDKDELNLFNKLKVCNKIKHIKFTSESELVYLYKNSIFFIFPSLYEGFGIPILEAFSSKCPVLISKGSSLEEIAGDAAEYFDPYNRDSIENGFKKMLYSESIRSTLIKKGEERLGFFSWDKTYQQTISLYKSIL